MIAFLRMLVAAARIRQQASPARSALALMTFSAH
ncbi:hypothetical protein QO011_006653 [Labrys wisconsinensis]|uniref:Uncharacterized protein n=1 Tax=Labrys wisconsinensis TaxID=425677 RepID=A0ABU0JH54_9HYPH|nr:hypothetical protein [Labrys wisconsinensis]